MEHLEKLRKYLSGVFNIPAMEWLHLVTLLRMRKLEKNSCYFRQGEQVDEIGFVVKGLLFNYYTDKDGSDFVKYFIAEGEVVACYSSLLRNIPATYTSQVLEATALVTLKYKDLQALYKRHACWEQMGRLVAERLYVEKEEREQAFLMADAKGRYDGFVKAKPGLVQRVPQYLIASYIGISPVSLSRIRAH